MSVPQDGFIALKPIIPSFHYSNIPIFQFFQEMVYWLSRRP
jgi:hypothetical protein